MAKGQATVGALLAALIGMAGLIPASGVAHAAPTNTVSVGDLNLVETDAGSANVKVPIVLASPAGAGVTVRYTVSAGTASAATDFKARTGTARFKPGAVEMAAVVKVNADAAVEANETINIAVTAVTGVAVADGSGVLTLVDNDANGVSATPEVTAGRPAVAEGNSGERKPMVPVRLSRPATTRVTVRFNTGCETRSVKFNPGQVSKNVGVPILPDYSANPDYTIPNSIQLTAGAATVPAPASGVTVRDDDGAGQPPAVGSTIRVSESATGAQAQYPVWACAEEEPNARSASISANGRYVAFESNATNLVPGDTNGATDVFVKDTWTGAIERASTNVTSADQNPYGLPPMISPDGRYVLFDKLTFFQWPQVWGSLDVYIYDRTTKTVQKILPGIEPGRVWASALPSISADNRYVTFTSQEPMDGDVDPDCPPTSPDCALDVFVLDRTNGTVRLITDGVTPDGAWSAISADGTSVAYVARGVGSDSHGYWVKDLATNHVEEVSVNSAEEHLTGAGVYSTRVGISANGRQIAFPAEACNLGVPCPFGLERRTSTHAYLRDRDAGTTTPQSYTGNDSPFATISTGVSLSADGRYVTYNTYEPTMIPGWTAACGESQYQVVQRDRLTGVRVRVSAARNGECPNGSSQISDLGSTTSANGGFVVFSSDSNDIVLRDRAMDEDAFVRRLR